MEDSDPERSTIGNHVRNPMCGPFRVNRNAIVFHPRVTLRFTLGYYVWPRCGLTVEKSMSNCL